MVSTAELLRPPIRTMGLTIYLAACLRDTHGPTWQCGQTDTLGSLGKILFLKQKIMPVSSFHIRMYDVLEKKKN